MEYRVERDHIVFLSRPKVVEVDTIADTDCQELNVSDLTHDNIMDPELSEMVDFTQEVKLA